MQTEISQPSGQRTMPETRFTTDNAGNEINLVSGLIRLAPGWDIWVCIGDWWQVGKLVVLGLTALWDSISVYIGPSLKERERKRGENIEKSENVQTTPTRTYCKRNRPLPYYHTNCRTPRHKKFTQDHRTPRPPSTDDRFYLSCNENFYRCHTTTFLCVNPP